MRTLVTGGLGFVGSMFVWAAVEAGRAVVVLDDGSAGTRPPMPAGVEVVTGDVGDRELVAATIAKHKPTSVVHFAGKIQVGESVTKPALYFDHNLVRAIRFLDTVREAGIDQIVFSSTAAVYGEPAKVPIPEASALVPVNPYGASKLAFEHVLGAYEKAYGLRWAALRYFNAAGAKRDGSIAEAHDPETHLVPLVLDAAMGRRGPLTVFGQDYATPDGTCVRDYIHVEDLASAHLAALGKLADGQVVGAVNLGTGHGHSVLEVLKLAAEVVGKPVPHAIGARRAGDPPALVADPSRAAALLGWKATRSDLRVVLEDALRPRRKA